MSSTFTCRECGKPVTVHFVSSGDEATCHSCGHVNRVPRLSDEERVTSKPRAGRFAGVTPSAMGSAAAETAPESFAEDEEPDAANEIDPAQLEYLRQRLESEQNLPLGLLAGFAASLIGAGVWAVITVFTGFQIGFMAVGVGLLVGYAVRIGGQGVNDSFGFIGAGFSLLGCVLGNLLAVVGMVGRAEGIPFFDVLALLTPDLVVGLMSASFSLIDLLFYGIAIYEGYKLAFRQLSEAELDGILHGAPAA